MPFIPHTPESLIPRSDSKNPATTCKGITSNGRPCRRALAASPRSSPNSNRTSKNGVQAILPRDQNHYEGAAAFFCWQHKEQAHVLGDGEEVGRKANIVRLETRTSLDTLVDRLGILDINEDESRQKKKNGRQQKRPAKKETLPQRWQDMPGGLIAVSGKESSAEKPQRRSYHAPSDREEFNFLLSFLCCVRSAEEESTSPPAIRRQSKDSTYNRTQTATLPQRSQPSSPLSSVPTERRQAHMTPKKSSNYALTTNPTTPPTRPSFSRDASSHTQTFLSLIPKALSPEITSALLAELAKPISPYDEEGFIYMFWLTPSESPAPTSDATSSLLGATSRPHPHGRRTSELVRQYAPSPSAGKTSILLKIGRASNVQRRMNEWSRQCNYNLSLIRYYPYVSSPPHPPPSSSRAPTTPPSPPADTPVKVPHAHKVERLIHLELADMRVRQGCDACGREHREWFEVEGSRQGVGAVDAVVRRWLAWSLGTVGR